MFKPDIVIAHPSHLQYPLWQKFIHENRDRFGKVIIVFTKMNADTGDYRKFVQDAMSIDTVTCLDNDEVRADQDWRDVAVNRALKYSNSEWVLFTEQDFFPLEEFWEEVERQSKENDIFGAVIQDRLHPCCIFAKREVIEKTSKNFGVVKDKLDHFGVFQQEVGSFSAIPERYWYHMNGLSQNLYMLQKGDEPNFGINEFKEYCERCLESEYIHEDFRELFLWYLNEKEGRLN